MFDQSCTYPFRIVGDTALYVMIDHAILKEALSGLSPDQKAAITAYQWTPSADQAVPQWAGAEPPPVYFRGTDAELKAALSAWYQAPAKGEPADSFSVYGTYP